MGNDFKLKMAKQLGEKVAMDEGFTELPVDPFKIAARHEIVVQAKPNTAAGVSGMLVRHGDIFGILYATQVLRQKRIGLWQQLMAYRAAKFGEKK